MSGNGLPELFCRAYAQTEYSSTSPEHANWHLLATSLLSCQTTNRDSFKVVLLHWFPSQFALELCKSSLFGFASAWEDEDLLLLSTGLRRRMFSRSRNVQLGSHWGSVRWPPPSQQMAQSPAVSLSPVSGVPTWALGQLGHGRTQREGWGTSPMPRTNVKDCTDSFHLKKLVSRCSDNWSSLN